MTCKADTGACCRPLNRSCPASGCSNIIQLQTLQKHLAQSVSTSAKVAVFMTFPFTMTLKMQTLMLDAMHIQVLVGGIEYSSSMSEAPSCGGHQLFCPFRLIMFLICAAPNSLSLHMHQRHARLA